MAFLHLLRGLGGEAWLRRAMQEFDEWHTLEAQETRRFQEVPVSPEEAARAAQVRAQLAREGKLPARAVEIPYTKVDFVSERLKKKRAELVARRAERERRLLAALQQAGLRARSVGDGLVEVTGREAFWDERLRAAGVEGPLLSPHATRVHVYEHPHGDTLDQDAWIQLSQLGGLVQIDYRGNDSAFAQRVAQACACAGLHVLEPEDLTRLRAELERRGHPLGLWAFI